MLVAIAGAACAGSGDTAPEPTAAPTSAAPTTVAPSFTENTVETTIPPRETFADGPLVEVCPDAIVIQIDDLPSVEHGPLFRLLAGDVILDDAAHTVRGNLVRPDGTAQGIQLEIRAGGPAVEFRTPLEVLSNDETVTFAEVSTAEAIGSMSAIPTVGVVALTDVSHQMLMWDPATYPEVTTIEELASTGAEIRHATGERFVSFLAEQGTLDPANLSDGFFGEPAAFVAAGGTLAQQGDSLVEPFLFPALPQWAKPIAFASAADVGWASYDDTLVARPEFVAADRECLGRLVRVLQEAIVSYGESPAPTNQVMADIRERFNPLTRAAPELLDQGAAAAVTTGVFGNGSNDVVGDFDLDRIDAFIAAVTDGSIDAEQLVSNDFIDLDVSM